jgi:hypothetical protein
MRCHGEVERLDAALAARARQEAGLRLRLGQVLEVLGRGQHFELGFSSVAAYALERCDRSVRWVEGARCLARRLEPLPALRRAMAFGRVSWSMGELLARVAQPHDEARWIEAAEGQTVREMRGRVLDALSGEQAAQLQGAHEHRANEHGALPEALTNESLENEDDGEMCTLTCTVNREEAWLFEATRTLLEQLGVHGADARVEALLAEGQATLLARVPPGDLTLDGLGGAIAAHEASLGQLNRWRAEAEASCEQHFRGSRVGVGSGPRVHANDAEPTRDSGASAAAVGASLGLASLEGWGCQSLDAEVRELSRSLGRHELELSQLVLQFHRTNGWRELGYASETQYARERLGLARSSLLARRALALRLEKLPRLAEALGAGQIGVEAAVQVARVATASTQFAWVERARQRTLKHLREEVGAALVAVRLSGEASCPPPVDAEMEAFHQLEQAVVSGRAYRGQAANDCTADGAVKHEAKGESDATRLSPPCSEPRRAWLVMLASLAGWLEGGIQMSAACGRAATSNVRSKGRIELRLRMSRANRAWWRGLEAQASCWLPNGMSWLAFLCRSIWSAWHHLLGTNVAYGSIYIRDRYRCSSPVCTRRDVTPHHLQFRSAGGSDDHDNVAAVCTWCHLFGLHGGRIRAAGTAARIRWEFGAAGSPCLVVHGRERVAA